MQLLYHWYLFTCFKKIVKSMWILVRDMWICFLFFVILFFSHNYENRSAAVTASTPLVFLWVSTRFQSLAAGTRPHSTKKRSVRGRAPMLADKAWLVVGIPVHPTCVEWGRSQGLCRGPLGPFIPKCGNHFFVGLASCMGTLEAHYSLKCHRMLQH